jgi:hypothetical protein
METIYEATEIGKKIFRDKCNSFKFYLMWLPLWSSGQSSWLQIRRPVFDSRHYQKKK